MFCHISSGVQYIEITKNMDFTLSKKGRGIVWSPSFAAPEKYASGLAYFSGWVRPGWGQFQFQTDGP